MHRWLLCFVVQLSLIAPLQAEEAPAIQWIAVTAPHLQASVKPLSAYRKAQGMRVVNVTTTDILNNDEIRTGQMVKLRDHIHQLCREFKGTSYVLLVGAVEVGNLPKPETVLLPPLPGTVSRMKGQPSDNGYGCLGNNLLPTVAVGRLPARSAEEAQQMVRKILEFEQDALPGVWRRRLTLLAGAPNFGPAVDKVIEKLAFSKLRLIDPSWHGQAIYDNPHSCFCLPDNELHDRALDYIGGGQSLLLYLGHSNAGGFRFLDRDDWARLKIKRGAGVFATFGCLGCRLTGLENEGYGVAAFRNPHGPVAVIGSHGVCFAAMVQLAADALFQSFCGPKASERLGDAWLKVKAGVAHNSIDPVSFWLLDKADGDPGIPQALQRKEHLEMFLLLGDPALRLPAIPVDIRLTASGASVPGKTMTIQGELPARLAGATMHISLERPLPTMSAELEPVPNGPPKVRDRILHANHERANHFTLATQKVTAVRGRFTVSLPLPDKLPGPRLLLHAYALTERAEGLGVMEIPVRSSVAVPRSTGRK